MSPAALSASARRLRHIGRFVALAVVVGLLGGELALRAHPYPVQRLEERPASWRLVDRDGDLLREAVGPQGARAEWVALDELSPWVVKGTLAVEDQRFHDHHGIDARAGARAVADSLRAGRVVSGASTLTMQLARLLADHPRTLQGKAWQVLDAVRLERSVDKATLLEHYLNRAPYGAGTIGVEAAAQRTFGVPSRHLSLAQGALIAGLPQAPSHHHPFRDPQAAKARQAHVLDRMLAMGFIDADQHAQALAEPLVLANRTADRPDAMHFTEEVLAAGPAPGVVHTTLDLDVQRPVERMVREHVASLSYGGLTQAAVVVLDNEQCNVLAMVGSTDWWDASVNGATAPRQPGSALKPFTYAVAFEEGFHPASVLADIPTRYLDGGGQLMRPRNYSERFTGPVLAGEALGRSLNVPAVRLANAAGIDGVLHTLRRAGFSTLTDDVDHYGLGLTLGNGEVTLLDLAQGYAAFARGGQTCRARLTADTPIADGERLVSEATAWMITDVLSDEALRIRAFGPGNPLRFAYPVAVKTGTSTNFRDSLTVGYTDRYTVAVWAGDFGGKPMDQLSGAVGAGPLFRQVMDHVVLQGSVDRRPVPAPPPDGLAHVEVCALSGQAPGDHCPHSRALHLPHDAVDPDATCDWHQVVRIDRRNGLRASDRCPSEHVEERVVTRLPRAYARWEAEHPTERGPSAWSPFCPPDALAVDAVVVTHPLPDDVFLVEPGYDPTTQTLELSVEVDPPVPTVTWYVDGQPVAEPAWPYDAAWPLQPGEHEVMVRVGDRASDPVSFRVRG